jgi:MoaA/NifB/PqqE/SkfB family radical SAM enzyme
MKKVKRIELFIVNKCNNRCIFCSESERMIQGEMNIQEIEKILKNGVKKNIKLVHLMGGEPTLHSKFIEILKLAKNLGYSIYLISNGFQFSDKNFCLASFPYIDELGFSLHGHNLLLHEHHVKTPGSFNKLLKALNNAKKYYKGRLFINITVTNLNVGKLLEIATLANQYQIVEIRFLNLVPSGLAKSKYEKIVARFRDMAGKIDKVVA